MLSLSPNMSIGYVKRWSVSKHFLMILAYLALLCGIGSRVARALPAQPLTLHGNLTVDGTRLKQSDPYFTR